MNYRILGKAVLTTLAWISGGIIVMFIVAYSGLTLLDSIRPYAGLIFLGVICITILGVSISDTYKNMVKKESNK